MECQTVEESFTAIQEILQYYRAHKPCHEYGPRCVKQDVSFITQVFTRLQMKVEEVRMDRQLQNYIEKLKPLLRSVQVQKNLKDNLMKLHKAGRGGTVEAQKLTIQHICLDIGLKYVEGNEHTAYISFDANEFYLELKFSDSPEGPSAAVTLVNEGRPEPQPEISETLKGADFTAFTNHLKGYIGIFNIPTEPRVRTVLLSALRALERDLLSMVSSQELSRDTINTSPVGHVIGSRGGLGAKVLYHHGQGDNAGKLDEEALISGSRDFVIAVECSTVNQLATEPLHLTRNEFKQRDQSNSEYLEASFVAHLGTPLVMTVERLNKLLKKLGSKNLVKGNLIQTTLLSLLLPHGEDRKVLRHEKLRHDYYLPGDTDTAILLHRIPFNHPTQVPSIVSALRQQELINSLILSCKYKSEDPAFSSSSKPSPGSSDRMTVDLSIVSGDSLECVFVHPCRSTLTVVTFDIGPSSVTILTEDTLRRAVLEQICARFLSIPLTLHGLLKILVHHHEQGVEVPRVRQARGEGRKEYEFKITDTVSTETLPKLEVPSQPQQPQHPAPQMPYVQQMPQVLPLGPMGGQPPPQQQMQHQMPQMAHHGMPQMMPQMSQGMPQMSHQMPPMSHPQGMPQISQGMPQMSQGMPPMSHQMPPMSHPQGMPQISQGMPPISQGMPPISQGMPPISQGMPPISQGMPPISQGMPPMSQGMPPISQGMPPISQGMPPISQGMPQMSQGMPQMSQGMPQMSQGMPQMSQGMPQMSQGMPQMSQGMPQMSQGMPQMSQQIRTPPMMSSPYDPSKLPSPPDIMAQKRKRPVLDSSDSSDLKKPAKLVKMSDPPGIPSLSPMSGLGPRMMRPVGPPVGPPTLKPAPIHNVAAAPGARGTNIPCLSPAPRMLRAPMQPGMHPVAPNLTAPQLQPKCEPEENT